MPEKVEVPAQRDATNFELLVRPSFWMYGCPAESARSFHSLSEMLLMAESGMKCSSSSPGP
jgi:hypothetical protein